MLVRDDLLGRWDIVSWEQEYDDGRRLFPMGEQLEGFIRYLPEGDMVCMISRRDRAAFTTGGQWDAATDELAEAYRSMLAYSGRFALDGEVVTHHVEQSLFPNWKGGQQRRHVTVSTDGTIALEARLEENTAEARTARLTWRRHAEGA